MSEKREIENYVRETNKGTVKWRKEPERVKDGILLPFSAFQKILHGHTLFA
jgi:hypothetical protein